MIRVGIAGWDYPDWEGIVYPSPLPSRFDRLAFLADLFDSIEINVTFYRQPDPDAARSWAGRVPAGGRFRFTAKLFRGLTHPATPLGRGRAGPSPESAGAEALEEATASYRAGIEPLQAAGLLGAVLMQFPHSFHDRPESRARVERLVALLPGLPLVAEFRHNTWDHDGALRFLHDLGVGFCNIDQPAVGATLRPTGHVTSRVAYIRLHGRNGANWFRGREEAASRYDYLYSSEELRPWIERARRLEERAEEIYIIANNHYRGKGPANALMIKADLSGRKVKAPAALVETYRVLREAATPFDAGPIQGRLF
jgi:uncharacterized protein YecE (DUF72 family)